jgi:hypothetical protein
MNSVMPSKNSVPSVRGAAMSDTRCPTCGYLRPTYTTDEGTGGFMPDKRMTDQRLDELQASVAEAKADADRTRAQYFPDHYDPYDWDFSGPQWYANELHDAYPELLDALVTERAEVERLKQGWRDNAVAKNTLRAESEAVLAARLALAEAVCEVAKHKLPAMEWCEEWAARGGCPTHHGEHQECGALCKALSAWQEATK